jgi:hypothetical protein
MDRYAGTLRRRRPGARLALLPVLWAVGCVQEAPAPVVELDVHCIEGVDFPAPVPSLESGPHRVTVRHLFPAKGCPTLRADLLRVPSGGFLVRVVEVAEGPGMPGGGDEVPRRVAYTVVISGLTPGRHQLRVVHVPLARRGDEPLPLSARNRALGSVTLVLDHPVLIMGPP